jgi:hypothetical protein
MQMCDEVTQRNERKSNKMSQAVEQTAQARLLLGFFSSGRLLPPGSVSYCTDDEYLSACLGMAQDLGRYCVNRACEVSEGSSEGSSESYCTDLIYILS